MARIREAYRHERRAACRIVFHDALSLSDMISLEPHGRRATPSQKVVMPESGSIYDYRYALHAMAALAE